MRDWWVRVLGMINIILTHSHPQDSFKKSIESCVNTVILRAIDN